MLSAREPRQRFAHLLLAAIFTCALHLASAQFKNCNKPSENFICDPDVDHFADAKIAINHAQNIPKDGFVYNNKFVDFTTIGSEGKEFKYRLMKCGCSVVPIQNKQVIFSSPKHVYVEEGPILGLLQSLGLVGRIKYSGQKNTIYNREVRERIDSQVTTELPPPNAEDVANYSLIANDDEVGLSFLAVRNPVDFEATGKGVYLPVNELQEPTALGRAEWMKIIGLIFDKAKTANDTFNDIVTNYNDVKKKAGGARRRPSVFFNYPFASGTYSSSKPEDERWIWFQPGQKQYITAIIQDANADYRFANDGQSTGRAENFTGIRKSFSKARFLLNSGDPVPLSTGHKLDGFITEPILPAAKNDASFEKLAKQLDAVKCGNVWSNQKRISADNAASDFFESAVFEPDVVLRDYVKILHPDVNIPEELKYSYSLGKVAEVIDLEKCPYIELEGDPESGKEFVNYRFEVPKKDRFEIDEIADSQLLPELSKVFEVGRNSIELLFTQKDKVTEDETVLTVRVSLEKGKVDNVNRTSLLETVKELLGEDVQDLDPLASPSPVPKKSGGGGGLNGGAIFGIILAVLVVVALVIYLYLRRRSRRRREQQPLAASAEDQFWDEGGIGS